ncbi:MAG: ABC transporter ATP-binding protein/permease, partial [Parafilimonas terrae]|nr:ABC transporter ATP-binding protein/permease [Parafilimonas terrae]
PSFFAKKITLGALQQTGNAFGQVQTSLSFFVDAYTTLAAYKANTIRLGSFRRAMTKAEALAATGSGLTHGNATGADVAASGLVLALPDGREIVQADRLVLPKGSATLVTGPSGSGKSTLFRAIAGVWPFGRGRLDVPAGQSALLLPQRPYIPLGTLRDAVIYPNAAGAFSDAEVRQALTDAQLPHLADRLDEDDVWERRLSGGEQQRLAIARALLAKPAWLFLDESTASLDEPSEAGIYRMLRQRLPETTIVSIGHRSTLESMHDRKVVLEKQGDHFVPREPMQAMPAE